MSDKLDTVWEAEPHTFAKHEILKMYFDAWLAILSRHVKNSNKSLLFVDGFAGPGKYKGGEPGSPAVVLQATLDHTGELPTPIRFLFIDNRNDRIRILKQVVDKIKSEATNLQRIDNITIKNGDCEDILTKGINKYDEKNKNLGPALMFLDQFGFSNISMSLIKLIMNHSMCEIFAYLHWKGINRFSPDQSKHQSINRAFGNEVWQDVLNLPWQDRAAFILNTYKSNLRTIGKVEYVWEFVMADSSDNPIYWLFFCTNHLAGLENMKKAMWGVDKSGSFRFSDKNNPNQLSCIDENSYPDTRLAEDIRNNFRGQRITVETIREYTLTETPAYIYKRALQILEKDGYLKPVNPDTKRRKGSFKCPNMLIEIS